MKNVSAAHWKLLDMIMYQFPYPHCRGFTHCAEMQIMTLLQFSYIENMVEYWTLFSSPYSPVVTAPGFHFTTFYASKKAIQSLTG